MNIFKSLKERLNILNTYDFNALALDIYHYQAANNPIFKEYHKYLNKDPAKIVDPKDFLFMPIEFFKTHEVSTDSDQWKPQAKFKSSGTTGIHQSVHRVRDIDLYKESSLRNFEYFFGSIKKYHLFALLPSYLERTDSSLVMMVDHFIKSSGSDLSGFYLHNLDQLVEDIEKAKQTDRQIILWGVSFALLDLVETYTINLSKHIVLETGGMKGRRTELTRDELHNKLRDSFNSKNICSEYGMTELLSQAYSKGGGYFQLPPWVKVFIREMNDPFQMIGPGGSGGMNIIDLANIHSCSFIETKDIGRINPDGSLEILGRYDNSDIRGCNLLVN